VGKINGIYRAPQKAYFESLINYPQGRISQDGLNYSVVTNDSIVIGFL
jgi:hypothetical protein